MFIQRGRRSFTKFLSIALVVLTTNSCATIQDNPDTTAGVIVGCGIGLAICKAAGGSDAACAAACVLGGGVGAIVGSHFDRRRRELQAAAARARLQMSLTNVSVGEPGNKQDGLAANFQTTGMFESDSAEPSQAAHAQFSQIGAVFAQRRDSRGGQITSKLLVTGHTDATGSASRNQVLSLQRARSIAAILVESGVPASDLYIKGAGSSEPVADNDTDSGRAQNRRVEILEIDSEVHLLRYARARRQDQRNLAHSTATTSEVAVVTPTRERPSTTGRANPPYNFAGQSASPYEGDLADAIGPPQASLVWQLSPVSSANATPAMPACYADAPRVDGDVFRFADGRAVEQQHEMSEYLPGMFGGAWGARVGDTKIGFGPVAVLRDGARPIGNPTIYLQKDVVGSRSQTVPGTVNTYEGAKGVLYRAYAKQSNAPIKCFDVVLPKSGKFASGAGRIFYRNGNDTYQAEFHPSLIDRRART